MIAQLTGTLLECTAEKAVVDVHGVGYEMLIPVSTAEKLPPVDASVTLYTSMAVREDAITLYGFATRQEKRLFETIVASVKGFGPRMALGVLSSMSIPALLQAVASEDLKLLSKINGVGKKSAAQLVLDLKGHIGEFGEATGIAPAAVSGEAAPKELSSAAQDAVKALETLGYKHDDAQKAIQAVLADAQGQELSTSALITRSLGKFRS